MSNEDYIQKIVEGIIDFKVIPFFGAGMSKPFGFKDWDELIIELKKDLATEEINNLKVAQLYEDAFGRSSLIEKLKACYTINNIEALNTDNHQLILAMSPPIIYTTNYDEALEETAKLIHRPYYKIASLKHIVEMPHKASIIVKFHGDFSAEEEIVLTESDYAKRMGIQNPLDILFRAHLLGKSVFFMGYALRDQNIDFLFNTHAKLYGNDNLPQSYLVTFGKTLDEARNTELLERNIHTILLDSPAELHHILKDINSRVFAGDYNRQIKQFFSSSSPQVILLQADFDNMLKFWINADLSFEEKANKFEETLSEKMIPPALQPSVVKFVISVIEDNNVPDETMDVILRTLFFLSLDGKYIGIELGISLVTLTEREYYQRLEEFRIQDALQVVEHFYRNESTILCIYAYLARCYEAGKKIPQKQLNVLVYTLRACKYQTTRFGEKLTVAQIDELLNHFIKEYPGWNPRKGIFTPPSFTDLTDLMLNAMPKNLNA